MSEGADKPVVADADPHQMNKATVIVYGVGAWMVYPFAASCAWGIKANTGDLAAMRVVLIIALLCLGGTRVTASSFLNGL